MITVKYRSTPRLSTFRQISCGELLPGRYVHKVQFVHTPFRRSAAREVDPIQAGARNKGVHSVYRPPSPPPCFGAISVRSEQVATHAEPEGEPEQSERSIR